MDLRTNFHPRRFVDPNEPGLVAAYTFEDGELAVHKHYINRAATGAAYDLTTVAGTPIVGHGGGIYVVNNNGSYYATGGVVTPGPSTTYHHIYTYDTAHNASRLVSTIGTPGVAHVPIVHFNFIGDQTRLSFDNTATTVDYGATLNRGPVFLSAKYDAATGLQYGYTNGRLVGSVGVVPHAPVNATWKIGTHDNVCYAAMINAAETDTQIRNRYIRDFASKILLQWQPRDTGEGPAGGILTGSYSGVGGYTCPLGAATMSFVQRPQGLTLTDSQTANLNRIDLEFGSRPWFGSWLIEYEVRDPATDNLAVGFCPMRGVDFTAASSASYWVWIRTAAGPWWRVSLVYENGTGAPIDSADAPWPGPTAGDRCKAFVSRDVDGTIQVWNWVPYPTPGWWFTSATATDATTLAEGCVSIAPRGPYVERVTWFQGAATPFELGL